MMFGGQGGSARPSAPFIWHNLAFDPFNLSPTAQLSARVPRWVTSTRFLTSWLSPPSSWEPSCASTTMAVSSYATLPMAVYGFRSHPIPATRGRRVAVRVISQFGEESTKVVVL